MVLCTFKSVALIILNTLAKNLLSDINMPSCNVKRE